VTIELKNGEIYRGHLDESEETMNCLVTDVVVTARDGRVTKLENVYIRGSQIKRERRAFRVSALSRGRLAARARRFMILPDLLKHSPVFEKVKELKKADDAKPRRGQRK
jgi:small nuclear ribonucleoprotein D3